MDNLVLLAAGTIGVLVFSLIVLFFFRSISTTRTDDTGAFTQTAHWSPSAQPTTTFPSMGTSLPLPQTSTRPRFSVIEFIRATIFFIVLIAAGLGVGAFGGLELMKYLESDTWEETRAEIIESRVEQTTGSEGDNQYKPVVKYRYGVGEEVYESDKRYFGQFVVFSSNDQDGAQEVVEKYRLGNRPTVYYDPDNPKDAVLEKRLGWQVYAIMGGAALLGLIGLIGILAQLRKLLGAMTGMTRMPAQ